MTAQTVAWGNPTVQWGLYVGGVWTTLNFQDGVFAQALPGTQLGFLFTPPGLQFNSGGRPLDNPVVADITLQLPCLALPLVPLDRPVQLWFHPGATTPLYSTSSPPLSRGETSLGTYTLQVANTIAPEYVELVVPSRSVDSIRALTTSRALWDGNLGFVLQFLGADGGFFLGNGPSLPLLSATYQEQAFSGLAGYGRSHGRVRAVRDSRFGIPTLSNRLVRDGENPSLWVRPSGYDPDDPADQFKPDPREGSVDDQIPS